MKPIPCFHTTVFLLTIAISILSGYGFVQYEEEGIARQACTMENGSLLKGNKLGVLVVFLY